MDSLKDYSKEELLSELVSRHYIQSAVGEQYEEKDKLVHVPIRSEIKGNHFAKIIIDLDSISALKTKRI